MVNLELSFVSVRNMCCKEHSRSASHNSLVNTYEKYITRPYDLDIMPYNLRIPNSRRLWNFHMLQSYHWSDGRTAISDREGSGSVPRKCKRKFVQRNVHSSVPVSVTLQRTVAWCSTALGSERRVWHSVSRHSLWRVYTAKYFIQVFRLLRRLFIP
jgi:hypothetical protein